MHVVLGALLPHEVCVTAPYADSGEGGTRCRMRAHKGHNDAPDPPAPDAATRPHYAPRPNVSFDRSAAHADRRAALECECPVCGLLAKAADARSELWRSLDVGKRSPVSPRNATGSIKAIKPVTSGKPLGRRATGTATIFLRSRDMLGNDLRSFLIGYLIGSPRGIRLRLVQEWTGYSYRSISEATVGWERAGVVRIQHGHCVLTNSAPWRELLECRDGDVVVVDWPGACAASIELLRTLRKAREKGFEDMHSLVTSAIATTASSLATAAAGADDASATALAHLRATLAGALRSIRHA